MDAIEDRIADFADIDTKRAMGYKPGKLPNSWNEFVPKTMYREDYRYYADEKKLVYYEFYDYNNMYSQVITNIHLIDISRPLFMIEENSVTREIQHFRNYTKTSEKTSRVGHLITAGIPIYVVTRNA